MDWEGLEALEARNATPATTPVPVKKQPSPEPTPKKEPEAEESTDDDSGDEYVAENVKPKLKVCLATRLLLVPLLTCCARMQRRRAHPPSSDSDTDTDNDNKRKNTSRHLRRPSAASSSTRARTTSASPGPSGPLKRRQSTASHQPEPKRKRSESDAGVDAARKYCLTKLQELFRDIFLRYPILSEAPETEDISIEKKTEELTPEEKEQLEEKANHFTTDLEECMYELYAEPDAKTGKYGVAAKYKWVSTRLRAFHIAHKCLFTGNGSVCLLST